MPTTMSSFSRRPASTEFKSPGSRYIGVGLVIILHIGIIYALYVSLAQKSMHVIPGDVKLTQIKDEQPKDTPPPPPPPPDFKPPPPFVPPPEISINAPTTATTAITAVTNVVAPPAPPPPPPAPAAPKVVAAPKLLSTGNAEPTYPAISKRLGEEGLVTVIVDVGADGAATAAAIEKSSGFPRLDAAAIEFAKSRHYAPGTEDGKPVPGKIRYQYRFRLNT